MDQQHLLLNLAISPERLRKDLPISQEHHQPAQSLLRIHNPKLIRQALELLQQLHLHQLEDKLQDLVLHQLEEDQQLLLLNLLISPGHRQPVLPISPGHHQLVLLISPGHHQPVLQINPGRLLKDQEPLLWGAPLLPELMAHDPDQMLMRQQEDQRKLVHLRLFHLDLTFPQALF